jgi:hypothetical protein
VAVPAADEPVKQFNVYLPTSLVRDVKLRAVTEERSLSKLTELALRAYLAHPLDPDDTEQDAR